MSRLQVRLLPDGRRLHLQDGPIDLVIGADGAAPAVAEAHRAAAAALDGMLDALCRELDVLRAPAHPPSPLGEKVPAKRADEGRPSQTVAHPPSSPLCGPSPLRGEGQTLIGPVARRMAAAVAPYAAETFITPMAAVAGAVADAVLDAMLRAADLDRAFVNDGGDIALHCAPGHSYTVGLVDRPDRPSLFGRTVIDAASGVRGIATSGWRGRSFSRGIADSVTVLAGSAATADAAATVVANAVDLPGHPAIRRAPADAIHPDSDLGHRLVTRDVGPLSPDDIAGALDGGLALAEDLVARGLILGAALQVQGVVRIVGDAGRPALPPSALPLSALPPSALPLSAVRPEFARHA